MNDIIKHPAKEVVGLLHEKEKGLIIPKPFEKDIFLFDTCVAGTTHIEGIDELEPYLNIGDKLEFFREPDNYYDKQAIVIKTENGVKIGYVPRRDNIIFSDYDSKRFGKSFKEKKALVKNLVKSLHE